MGKIKHFVTTAYLVNKTGDKVALTHHKLTNSWLGFGGHIEERETIMEALKREIKEESGITNYKLFNKGDRVIENTHTYPSVVEIEAPPNVVQTQPIKGDNKLSEPHDHIDLVYFGKANQEVLKLENEHAKDIGWFGEEDFNKIKLLESTKYLCEKALETARSINE